MLLDTITLKITLAYDGSRFLGSAKQPHTKTVQGELEIALKKLGINEKTIFSGRTDKGVHATRQIVSVNVPLFWKNTNKLQENLNTFLVPHIYINKIEKKEKDFHARFSANTREYRYIISLKPFNAFLSSYMHFEKNLNVQKLSDASKLLIGTHDFKSFSKKGSDPSSTIRTINGIKIYQYKEYIILKFVANAYLRSQVRMMVDFLLKISKNELTNEALIEQLSNHRSISNSLAPSSGLYLTKVVY